MTLRKIQRLNGNTIRRYHIDNGVLVISKKSCCVIPAAFPVGNISVPISRPDALAILKHTRLKEVA